MSTRPARATAPPYADPLEHLSDEMRRIQLLLDRQTQILRHQGQLADNPEFQGMFLQESEIDALLADTSADASPYLARVAEIDREVTRLRQGIAARVGATPLEQLSLPRLKRAFRLDDFEVDVVLLSLAPELDLKFHKLYSYVQNDFTRKRPSVNLAVGLLRDRFDDRIGARSYFAGDGTLIRYRLILLDPPPIGGEVSLLTREFKLSDRVVDFLVGRESVDEELADFCRVIEPSVSLGDVLIPQATKDHVSGILSTAGQDHGDWPVMLFHGVRGVGKKMLAEALCGGLKIPLLTVSLAAVPRERTSFSEVMLRVLREAGLRQAALFLDDYHVLHGEDSDDLHGQRSALHRAVASFPGPVFLGADTHELKLGALEQESLFRVGFAMPVAEVREALWRRFLPAAETMAEDVDPCEIALKFNLSGGAIKHAVIEAGNLAAVRPEGDGKITRDDLFTGCRAQLTHQLSSYADRVVRKLTWEDLVVPDDVLDRLRDVVNFYRRREFVFDEWGFDRKLGKGRGLSVLFSGPPGTGKTMVAGIIAGELEMDLYKIDLSRVVSKYVGETEKNLAKIFDEAKESHSIILFDEADSLFSKRTEVKSSIDRYANLEVNFLLQRMETFDGISILTTNFEKNIDEAFKRRLNFRIHFPFPEEDARLRMWQVMIPAEAPTSDDIDWAWLAERYDVAGGNIKNAVLRAAFLAAERGTPINHEALQDAAVREIEEIGKLVRTGD